jgi:hypothetical protein
LPGREKNRFTDREGVRDPEASLMAAAGIRLFNFLQNLF